VTRRDKNLQPEGGWYPDERMTPEETLRGYTIWGAYSAFMEQRTGTLQAGKWADITVVDLDMLNVGETDPAKLLQGRVLYTIVAGKVVFTAQSE
jgi:predicted amidohydrolase YtcJ